MIKLVTIWRGEGNIVEGINIYTLANWGFYVEISRNGYSSQFTLTKVQKLCFFPKGKSTL